MKWLRVKVDYYSDFIKETKEKYGEMIARV